ncbi:MAG: C40 family peptidase [Oscillospiraceae bacterium]|nr:C40 family peptidase [Oscillospiraceae bacterium]
MATANELLTIARKQLGICENPPNSNNVRYNTWYYGREVTGSAYPWCMAFVQWVFAQAGVKLPIRTASCGALMNAAKSAGCWVVRDFQPGDVVIYDFPGGAATDHCGIIELPLPDYGVQAIEGNTSQSGSQSNGGMVCRKNRPVKYIVGAVRPKYDPEKKEDIMTGKEIYDALSNYLNTQKIPAGVQSEYQEAVQMGITDGTNPCQLIPRWQAAIMAKRAAEKAKN